MQRSLPLAGLVLACATLTTNLSANTAAPTAMGTGPDDINVSTITGMSYQTFCSWILQGLNASGYTAANGWNFAFAGSGAASAIANIPSSDFTPSYYQAWVVTNDAIPNGTYSSNIPTRPVNNQDAGGADFVLAYTPNKAGGTPNDPTNVHFLQAFIDNVNGAGFGSGVLDNIGGTAADGDTPFYDVCCTSGTDGATSWVRDIPFTCESGAYATDPTTGRTGCGAGVDETTLSESVLFQMFVVSSTTVNLGGTPTYILYGGEQWGYTYTNTDVPEPSLLLLSGVGILACVWRRTRS